MKRAIALSFLLLANIALLVHAVIPHHHHNELTVCFFATTCTDSAKAHKHTHGSDCQHHHDGSGMEECPLKKMFVRFENNKLFDDLRLDNDIQYPVLFLFPIHPIVEITGLKDLPFRQNPYLLSCYTDYIAPSLGLRAPPVEL